MPIIVVTGAFVGGGGELAPWLSERCPVTSWIFFTCDVSDLSSGTCRLLEISLISLQAELKALTDRLIVIYELQPIIFGQLVHLRKLSK